MHTHHGQFNEEKAEEGEDDDDVEKTVNSKIGTIIVCMQRICPKIKH